MNNESSSASFASGYATVTKVGQLAIFNYFPGRNNHEDDESDKNKNQNTVKQCIDLCFSLDNSLSMGGLTKRAAEIFCHGLVGKIPGCDTRGTLVAFDTKGYVILSNFTNSAAISSVDFPKQGMTNITAGVDLAIESITENHRNDARKAGRAATNLSTVHCLVFVSDGIHNTGPKITDQHIKAWRNKIDTLNLRLAVIVVGIDSNDTSLGMQIKSGLENVRIKGLAPVYYAKNGDDMQIVLTSLVDCLSKSFAGSAVVNFSLRGGRQGDHPRFLENNADNMASIIEDGGNQQTSFCLPVVMMGTESAAADNKEQEELLQLLRADFSTSNECANKMEEYRIKIAERIPQLFVNGAPVPVKIVDFTENDIANAINALVPSLAQERVAYGAERIAAKRSLLAKVIDVADELVTVLDHRAKRVAELKKAQDNKNGLQSDDAADVNKKNSSRQALMTGSDRARMLKLAKQTRHRFAEERASLNRLAASLSDNSAELASFLNGASRKYAAKALIRADMVGNVSAETVLNSLRDNAFVSELKAALAKDKELMAKRSADINENNMSTSILSLQTAMETYEDWITILENPDAAVDPADVYSCLVAFSLFAHPVEFAKTAAAQMSPLQTFCLDIECGNLDTGSLFLAKQDSGSFNLKGQMGKKIEQAFALVDPSCPHISSLILRRSQIAQINNSVNICSDLFMVHPEQNFSQHVHTFAKAVEKYAIGTSKSRAYLGLAVKILYSFRRMFASGKAMTDKQAALLKRWLIDGSTITTSEEDGCDHPYALPFLLAACDLSAFLPSFGANADVVAVTDCVVSSRAPVMNLLNEWFARKCKMVLNRFAQAKNHANTTVAAFAALRQYFGVKASNSPSPLDDVLASEPSVEAVKESCQHWVDDGDLNPEILSGLFYGGEGGEAATASPSRSVNTNNDSVEASIVKKELQQIYLAYKFARALQLYFAHEQKSQGVKDWKSLIAHMEQHLDIPASLGNFIDNMKIENDDILEKVISQSMFVKNDDDDAIMDNKKKSRIAAATASVGPQFAHGTRQFYQSIIAQGMLYHDSSSRQQVDEHDVTDPVTLQDMVISLRMAVYFEKCQVKRAHYLSIIGDVTYASAMSAQESQFAGMLGVHTHGLSREKFWAFLRACEGSDAKALAFREKSNDTLKSETAFNCALGRALRKRN